MHISIFSDFSVSTLVWYMFTEAQKCSFSFVVNYKIVVFYQMCEPSITYGPLTTNAKLGKKLTQLYVLMYETQMQFGSTGQ